MYSKCCWDHVLSNESMENLFALANIDPDEGESKHSKIARIEYDSNNFEWEKNPSIIKIVINIETKGIFHKKIKQDL